MVVSGCSGKSRCCPGHVSPRPPETPNTRNTVGRPDIPGQPGTPDPSRILQARPPLVSGFSEPPSRGLRGLQQRASRGFQGPPRGLQGPSGGLLRLGARTPPKKPLVGVTLKMGCDGRAWTAGLGYSHQGENQCTLYIFGLEAGLCLPMCGKSPEGLYTSTLHRLLPLSYPVRVYRLTCIFSV